MGYNISKVEEFFMENLESNPKERINSISNEYSGIANHISSLSKEELIKNFIDHTSTDILKKIPITSFFETKFNTDLLYSHPDMLEQNTSDVTNINGKLS